MLYSKGLSKNPYPESNKIHCLVLTHIYMEFILILSSHLRLAIPRGSRIEAFFLNIQSNMYCIVLMGWSLLPNALRPF